jgi:hypothetical protein
LSLGEGTDHWQEAKPPEKKTVSVKTEDPEVLNAQDVSTEQRVAGLDRPEYVPVKVIEPVIPVKTFVTDESKTEAVKIMVDEVALSGGTNLIAVYFLEGVIEDPVACEVIN